MPGLRLHALAVLLALRLEARSRARRPIVPRRREGRGVRPLDAREAERAVRAARRAVARICTLDSCLTRSIVLFQLLERRHAARLEIGFPAEGEEQGHAWVTVGGVPLGEAPEALLGMRPVGESPGLPVSD